MFDNSENEIVRFHQQKFKTTKKIITFLFYRNMAPSLMPNHQSKQHMIASENKPNYFFLSKSEVVVAIIDKKITLKQGHKKFSLLIQFLNLSR